jgi:ATPase subunit of ABC transporter with duplicated ATPase domains
MVLQVRGLKKEFESIPVLTDVSFHLAGGERVGLVGANGCGKSTLLKILAGELAATAGSATWVTAGLSRAYLAQEGHWNPALPLGEQMGTVSADLLARCGITSAMLTQPAGTLSGGQKTRAALARVLATRPHLLLLDEPTNHLDTEGLQWLESMLAAYRGTVLVISHDRFFLDQVATRILELEGGAVRDYPGNYSAYARQKQAERERAEAEYRQFVNLKKQLTAAIQRQLHWAAAGQNAPLPHDAPPNAVQYNRAQAQAHMQVVKVLQQRIERAKVEKPKQARRINLRLDGQGEGGRNQILAERLGFSYDGRRWLFRQADFYVQRGDRVAIVGPNGSGKTTLVKLLLGELSPTEGAIYRSPVKVGYLEQELQKLNPAQTVLEEATGNSALDQAYARTLLGGLLFPGETVLKPVGVLSGGEKVRLALAKILLAAPDMLVLDEPTNSLDLPSRERVEEALEGYPGTLLMVSHDRYLLRRIANRVMLVDGGRLQTYGGGYAAFLQRADRSGPADVADRRLLLETRLARLSAALAAPPEGEKERLTAEFINVSRELRALGPG